MVVGQSPPVEASDRRWRQVAGGGFTAKVNANSVVNPPSDRVAHVLNLVRHVDFTRRYGVVVCTG